MATNLSVPRCNQTVIDPVATLPSWVLTPNIGSGGGSATVTFPTLYNMDTEVLCEPGTGNRVIVVFSKLQTALPGTAPSINAFNFPGMTAYAGTVGNLVVCGGNANATTINTGTFQSSTTFTEANLPGIAGGGILQAVAVMNTGAADITVTGTDGHVQTVAAGGMVNWQVDDSRDQLEGFAVNATGSTAAVIYTYR